MLLPVSLCTCVCALQKLSCAYFILPVDLRVFLVGICASPKTGKHSKAQSLLNGKWSEGTGGRGLQHGTWPAETPLTVNRQGGQVLQQPHYATPPSGICTSHTSTPTPLHTGHRTQDTGHTFTHCTYRHAHMCRTSVWLGSCMLS